MWISALGLHRFSFIMICLLISCASDDSSKTWYHRLAIAGPNTWQCLCIVNTGIQNSMSLVIYIPLHHLEYFYRSRNALQRGGREPATDAYMLVSVEFGDLGERGYSR